jgi:hypothetical protein
VLGYEVAARFEALQQKLAPLWRMIGRPDPGGPPQDPNTIVVVPSITIDWEIDIIEHQVYEERFLFMLFLLRQPDVRMIYVTSLPVRPSVIDYYLDILPGVVASSARQRLVLVTPQDGGRRPLTRKLLDRPRLLRQIRDLIPDRERAHLVPFNTTDLERELAVRLGIPMYAADPRFFCFGTKSGSRMMFAQEGVPHPMGVENLFAVADMVAALATMRARKPAIERAIAKLNEGVGGMGNAVVDLRGLPPSGDPEEAAALADRLRAMRFEVAELTFDWYAARVEAGGAIIEEMIAGDEIRSPSAQLRITPLGEVQRLSTHDQLLGGPSGQSYLGARFPADVEYGPQIMREADKIGRRLAREGIVGRFAVDFIVVRRPDGGWDAYAIEVNLRKGGTTHPFLTLQFLTDGRYDADAGRFATALGHEKFYVASDHVESPRYRAFTPDDLFEIVSRHRLHFDHTSQTGVVLHMVSGVGADGRLGATAIGDSPAAAEALYQRLAAVLDEEARITSNG